MSCDVTFICLYAPGLIACSFAFEPFSRNKLTSNGAQQLLENGRLQNPSNALETNLAIYPVRTSRFFCCLSPKNSLKFGRHWVTSFSECASQFSVFAVLCGSSESKNRSKSFFF